MRELLQKLLEERARETGELRKCYETAEARDTGWTAEDKQEAQRRNDYLTDLDSRIRIAADSLEGDRQADEMRAGVEKLLGTPRENLTDPVAIEERAVADFFAGKGGKSLEVSFAGLKTEHNSAYRRMVREDVERRAGLVDGTTTAGGYLYGPTFRAVLYQHLIFNSAIRQTNATILTTDSGENLLLPKTTAHPARGTIVSEAAVINENDPTFGQGTLQAYKYGNLVQVSTELEEDVAVDLMGYLAKQMGIALGNGSGYDMTVGAGTSGPQGVVVGAGTIAQVVGGTPAASGATFNELTQVFDKIIPPYQVNAQWFISQSAVQKIRALVDTYGRPIFLQSLSGEQPSTLFGKPIIIDPNMPVPATNGTSVLFGDFSSYFIRDVQGIRFERSIDYAFNTDLVTYRALLRTDGRLLDLTGAIATYKGGTA